VYYLRKYEVEGKMINTSLDVQHYAGQPYSLFGYRDQFAVGLRGQTNEDGTMSCQGHIQSEPGLKMEVVLRRLAELP
jgi:hypothetical protein